MRPAKSRGPRRVLDAGCGRALGLLGAATLQPDVQFVGADINRVALAEAQEQAATRGLKNIRFVECDLMTLAGLDIPPGGFDVIHSSGVLHHLSDPAAGLNRLREALAPHGLINLMVYGRYGREPLMQVSAAIGLLFPPDTPLAARLPLAREVAALAREHVLPGTRFLDTATVDDVEMVDRVLNVNETSYEATTVMQVLESAGLQFLRWIEPADWDPSRRLPDGSLRRQVAALRPLDQWRFLELMYRPAGLELVVGHAGNALRAPLTTADVATSHFRLSPEVVIGTGVRHTPAGLRTEQLSVTVRTRPPLPINAGPAAAALMLLKDEARQWSGQQLIQAQVRLGATAEIAEAVVLDLVKHEILMRAG
jgi:SAM-dependent methyltransferase